MCVGKQPTYGEGRLSLEESRGMSLKTVSYKALRLKFFL